MKIHLASDLHFEINNMPTINFKGPIGADILILAGDIFCTRHHYLRRTDAESRSQKRTLQKFAQTFFPAYNDVFFIAGNHESYGDDITNQTIVLKEILEPYKNVKVFENDFTTRGDFLFFGATFWTDCRHNPNTELIVQNTMNDYKQIRTSDKTKFTVKDSISKHNYSYDELKNVLNIHGESYKPVIMTHHAPCIYSVHPRERTREDSYAYFSDMSNFIFDYEPILWVCGHTHYSVEYMIGNTRIVSNCYGYRGIDRSIREKFSFKEIEI